MTQQVVNVGAVAGDGTGDKGQVPFNKTNANITELYGSATFGVDSGAVNAYILLLATLFPQPAAAPTLKTGQIIRFVPLNINTGAATVNWGATGAITIVNWFGNALTGGEINGPTVLEYNGTNWQLIASACPVGNQRTAAETAAGVTPVNFAKAPGDLLRFGTNTTPGTTDMTTAANNWASVGGQLFVSVPGIYQISNTIIFPSNCTVSLVEGVVFRSSVAGISQFKASSQSNVIFQGGSITQTANSSTVHIGLIELAGCTNCNVNNMELIGAQWHAVLLNGSSNCVVEKNYIHNSLGVTTADVDSCDISCYGASSFNTIRNNICYGGTAAEHGVMIQDPGGSLLPLKNLVDGNKVGPHKAYGILNYLVDHANTYCTIVNNEVEGITGTAQSGNSGAGIYNQGAGGTIIANNIVRNCCISTSGTTLLPAGIALNLDASMEPVLVNANQVLDMPQFYGIEVVTGAATLTNNIVKFLAGSTANRGIFINLASNVKCSGNQVYIDTSISNGDGIFVFANGGNNANIQLTDNYVNGCSNSGIRVDTTGVPTNTNITINGNECLGGSSACISYRLGNIVQGTMTGNIGSATTVNAVNINACTQLRVTGNMFTSTGTVAVATNGTCTGSNYDMSNFSNTQVDNAGTGFRCEQLLSAVPSSSSFHAQNGDHVTLTTQAASSSPGAYCTTAGNPGTWKNEANLSA